MVGTEVRQLNILSLCDYTGEWSRPYREAGYNVIQVDLQYGEDIRLFKMPTSPIRGVLAAPPCTHFASSGARWWADKGESPLLEGLALVDACLRFVAILRPVWWALENPVGRLNRWLGDPKLRFQPCDYGDTYTKKTCLWGEFTLPDKSPVEPVEGSKMHLMPPSPDRAARRSKTPAGFAKAFYRATP